jgi:predicted CDP-diglyceride synthetase/phosphatidate cytidylyltransferase
MSDRAALFLFSILMIVVSLGAAGWLLVTGQAGTVDGLFLLLTALLSAAVFGLYVKFTIGKAMEAQKIAPALPAGKAAPKMESTPVKV